jgi:hypothetical protein
VDSPLRNADVPLSSMFEAAQSPCRANGRRKGTYEVFWCGLLVDAWDKFPLRVNRAVAHVEQVPGSIGV